MNNSERVRAPFWSEDYIDASEDNSMIFQMIALLQFSNTRPETAETQGEGEVVSLDVVKNKERMDALVVALIMVLRERLTGEKTHQEKSVAAAAHDQGLAAWLRGLMASEVLETITPAAREYERFYENACDFKTYFWGMCQINWTLSRAYGDDWYGENSLKELSEPDKFRQSLESRQPASYDSWNTHKKRGYVAACYALLFPFMGVAVGSAYALYYAWTVMSFSTQGWGILALTAVALFVGLSALVCSSFLLHRGILGSNAHCKLRRLMREPGTKPAVELYDHLSLFAGVHDASLCGVKTRKTKLLDFLDESKQLGQKEAKPESQDTSLNTASNT